MIIVVLFWNKKPGTKGGAGGLKKEKEKEKKKKREKQSVNSRASEEPAAEPPFSESSLPEHTDDLSGGMNDLRQALEELGGKWRLQVLWSLRSGGELRYGTIKSAIPGITDMMLSQSLRDLCQSGLVERQQYQEIPPRVEYRIRPEGITLIPVIQWLIDWQKNRMTTEL